MIYLLLFKEGDTVTKFRFESEQSREEFIKDFWKKRIQTDKTLKHLLVGKIPERMFKADCYGDGSFSLKPLWAK